MDLISSLGKSLPYMDKLDPWSSHAWISTRLKGQPSGTRVLDVGAASGTLGRLCSGKDLVLCGIEPQLEWAEVARPYYDVILCSTLDQAPDEFLRDYEVIVLADVLERMPDPELTLQRLTSLEAKDTMFIISVPNIANIYVRINLLFGRFNYTDRGILDRTHLHFFTRRTLIEMLNDVGLQVKRLEVTPLPLNLVHPFFERTMFGRLFHRSLAFLTRLFPTLLGYQFMVEARRKD